MNKHQLVVLGDSLSQGFMSGAIHRTDVSWGAMIAQAAGVRFDVPDFSGEGGLPINLEELLRRMSSGFGERIAWYEVVPMLAATRSLMDRVEDYWERGKGTAPYPMQRLHHNLAVWGFEAHDAYLVTEALCDRAMLPPHDDFLKQIPEDAMYRTARRTLNPSLSGPGREWSAVEVARQLAGRGGVENLFVALGANNALGTVLSLTVKESTERELGLPPHRRNANLYTPDHFARIYRNLAHAVEAVGAASVFVATVPHVTIPPVTRGVSTGAAAPVPGNSPGRKYYEYYTRPWIWDDVFDPGKHPHLTRAEAIRIDDFIDEYNAVIRATAGERDWHLVDLCKLLDDLAFRSSAGQPTYRFPAEMVAAIKANRELSYLESEGNVSLDTRFFKARRKGKKEGRYAIAKGGLFSLDGVHPTTMGYMLVADLFLTRMKEEGALPAEVSLPWKDLVDADTLAKDPPALLVDLQECLANLEKHWGLSQLLEAF